MTERELFEECYEENNDFMVNTQFLMEGDRYLDRHVRMAWIAWQASANRQGYKLVPVDADADILIINGLSIHIIQTGSGRVFCDITNGSGNLISQKKSMEDAINFCKGYSYVTN